MPVFHLCRTAETIDQLRVEKALTNCSRRVLDASLAYRDAYDAYKSDTANKDTMVLETMVAELKFYRE